MKSVPKLIRRFVRILMLSMVLLIILNVLFYAFVFARNTTVDSAWDNAERIAGALQPTGDGYELPQEIVLELEKQSIWAVFIDDDTKQVAWRTDNLPEGIPTEYTLSDISNLTLGYINGYPTFTGEAENGLLVLGYPKDSYWKLIRPNWSYNFIANLPKTAMTVLGVNVALIFLIYVAANAGLLRSIKPITGGIQDLSCGMPVYIKENGVLSEIAAGINKASFILQKQAEQLRKKETARANWIAGVSHDIRTPLSMVMGYAGQLENSHNLPEAERRKASVIVKRSMQIKDLISELNLASKLEYDMQPFMKKRENVVAVVRQVVVDFINMGTDDRFPIEWDTDISLTSCYIDVDKELFKRAISNLIQNSISHNEDGCRIYVSVNDDGANCVICVEDSGVGVTDAELDKLNRVPHYMVCDSNTTEQRHGLGLLIVKQIVEGHNGRTNIEHSNRGGLRVVITIPKQ